MDEASVGRCELCGTRARLENLRDVGDTDAGESVLYCRKCTDKAQRDWEKAQARQRAPLPNPRQPRTKAPCIEVVVRLESGAAVGSIGPLSNATIEKAIRLLESLRGSAEA